MPALILSRILQAIPVLLVVGFISFAMFNFIGDPISGMLPQDASAADRQELATRLGLDQPFPVQYFRFMVRALHGEFGLSYRLSRPVGGLIAERLPATLELAVTASFLALLIGVPMGVYTGIRPARAGLAPVHGRQSDRRVAATVPDRHPADPGVLGGARLAAEFRARRRRGDLDAVVVHRLPDMVSGLKALILPAITLGIVSR